MQIQMHNRVLISQNSRWVWWILPTAIRRVNQCRVLAGVGVSLSHENKIIMWSRIWMLKNWTSILAPTTSSTSCSQLRPQQILTVTHLLSLEVIWAQNRQNCKNSPRKILSQQWWMAVPKRRTLLEIKTAWSTLIWVRHLLVNKPQVVVRLKVVQKIIIRMAISVRWTVRRQRKNWVKWVTERR